MTGLQPIYSFLEQSQKENLPTDVTRAAKKAFIDTICVMLAGSRVFPLPQITKRLPKTGANASIAGLSSGYEAQSAAFYNATAAHVLDMDDCDPYMGHPSAVLIPAILALSETLSVSGQKALQAYACAYQAGYALGRQCCYDISAQGWHATSVIMNLVSAWACGFLLGFNHQQFDNATTIAASFASGVRGNFGTPVKPIHAGLAAQNGLLIAHLAKNAVSGSEAALFGKEGFFNLFARLVWNETKTRELIENLHEVNPLLNGTQTLKLFPSCSSNHQAVFAFLDILKEHPDLGPNNVASIDVFLNKWALGELVTPKPKTGVEARFSPAFHFALALKRLPIRADYFQTKWVNNSEIQDIINKTELKHDCKYDTLFPWPARVVIKTIDGQEFLKVRDHIPGGNKYPLTEAELKEKFLDCSIPILGLEKSEKLLALLQDLDNVQSIGEITHLLY